MKRNLVLASTIITLALLAASTTPALAGRGGKGGGGGTTGGNATVYADPDPSAAYSYIRIKGCGYMNDRPVQVNINHGAYMESFNAWVWASGCIDFGFWTAEAGTYELSSYQTVKRSQVLMGSGQMTVQ